MSSLDYIYEYARQIVLRDIGLDGQERLMESRVAIIGLGGLGTPISILLSIMGVGHLKIIDRDIVSVTDLHRQPLYTRGDVDTPKVEVAESRLREYNPRIEIEAYAEPLNNSNVDRIVSDVDLVMDGLDSMRARYILNRAVVKYRRPYIFSSAIEMYGNISTIIPYDSPCLECFYGDIDEKSLPTCAEIGVHPSITFNVASIAVSEATRIIKGDEPRLKGYLLYIDLRNIEMGKVLIKRDKGCPVCGSRPRHGVEPIELEEVEVSCARDGSGIIFVNRVIPGLNLDGLAERLESIGLKVLNRSKYSISFRVDDNLSGVIMNSGVMVCKSRFYTGDVLGRIRDIYGRIVG